MSVSKTPWGQRAYDLLADGEWHDGASIMAEMRKLIPPGIAWRVTEAQRLSQNPNERKVPRRPETLIAYGKHNMIVSALISQVRSGGVECDPWPLPKGAWKMGAFRLRRPHATYRSLTDVAKEMRVTVATLRRLTDIHDVPVMVRGRKTLLSREAVEKLTPLVERHKRR